MSRHLNWDGLYVSQMGVSLVNIHSRYQHNTKHRTIGNHTLKELQFYPKNKNLIQRVEPDQHEQSQGRTDKARFIKIPDLKI